MRYILTFYLLFVSFDGRESAMPKPKYDKNMGYVTVFHYKSRYETLTDSLKKLGIFHPETRPKRKK